MHFLKVNSFPSLTFFLCTLACICFATPADVSLSPATLVVRENATATLRVVLNEAVAHDVSGCYRTLQTQAAVGSQDYVEVNGGSWLIPAGQTEVNIYIDTIDDSECELVEYFTGEIYDVIGGTLTTATQCYIGIIDDEPGIQISGGEYEEGEDAVFNVTMSCAPAAALTISYSTQSRTARGDDYSEVSGSQIQMLPGEYWRPIKIPVTNDDDQELRESFACTLTASSDGTIVTETAVAFIPANDWPVFKVEVAFKVRENVSTLEIEVQLGKKSPFPVTVLFATLSITAKEGEDFEPAVGILEFAPFTDSKTIEIVIVDDPIYEQEEKFELLLFQPSNAIINNVEEIIKIEITIVDDDPIVRIAEGQETAFYEGDTAVIVLVLEAPAPYDFTVNVSTTTLPDDTAMPNLDYIFVPVIQVPFYQGDTEANFSLSLMNDLLEESNETFAVTLSASNATPEISALGLTVMDVVPSPSASPSSGATPSTTPSISPSSSSSSPASPSPSSTSPSTTLSSNPTPSSSSPMGQQPVPVAKKSSGGTSAAVTGTAFGVGGVGIAAAVGMGVMYIRNKRKMDPEP